MNNFQTSLVVLNYNDFDTTSRFIQNIYNFRNINNIVIVDNNSTDNSYNELKKLENLKIKVIKTTQNKGYANGNNFGVYYTIKYHHPKYIFIANPDVIIDEQTIDKLVNFGEIIKDFGTITCRMDNLSNINLPLAFRLPTYKDCLIETLFVLKKLLNFSLEYNEEYLDNDYLEVDCVPGSFFMMNTDTFLQIKGFDEETFLYYEECILGYKLKKLNKKNYLITDVNYIHDHSKTINKNINSVKKRLEIAQDSRVIYCRKYLKCNNLKILILKITFKIGLLEYLLYLKILNGIKKVMKLIKR